MSYQILFTNMPASGLPRKAIEDLRKFMAYLDKEGYTVHSTQPNYILYEKTSPTNTQVELILDYVDLCNEPGSTNLTHAAEEYESERELREEILCL